MNLKDRLRDIETDSRNRLHDLAPPNHECPNSTHIDGACRAGGGAVHSIRCGHAAVHAVGSDAPTAVICQIAKNDEMGQKGDSYVCKAPGAGMGGARSLQLQLNANWEEVKEVSKFHVYMTYMRKRRTNNNALQVSVAINTSDVRPEINPEKVIVAWVECIGGEVVKVSSSESDFGKMATATFSAKDFAHCQAWFSTDGADVIQATFICDGPPGADELTEVLEMVRSMNLGEGP
jgi:hypothetical protein